jgi:hypothetical protein
MLERRDLCAGPPRPRAPLRHRAQRLRGPGETPHRHPDAVPGRPGEGGGGDRSPRSSWLRGGAIDRRPSSRPSRGWSTSSWCTRRGGGTSSSVPSSGGGSWPASWQGEVTSDGSKGRLRCVPRRPALEWVEAPPGPQHRLLHRIRGSAGALGRVLDRIYSVKHTGIADALRAATRRGADEGEGSNGPLQGRLSGRQERRWEGNRGLNRSHAASSAPGA